MGGQLSAAPTTHLLSRRSSNALLVPLSMSHYRIQPLCRVPVTLGKGQFALGKLFAECNTRQTPLGKASHGTVVFAECRISGTRHRSHVARSWFMISKQQIMVHDFMQKTLLFHAFKDQLKTKYNDFQYVPKII